jgi:predicted dehydrogenase
LDTIGVGIIGASPGPGGWAATAHVPALHALSGFELRAVSTTRTASADAAAAAYGVTGYADASALIAHPGVDLVVVAVKVTGHATLVAEALTAGRMVYSEWPLGVDLTEAQRLADLASVSGLRTVIGLQGRYSPQVAQARRLVDEGYVGDVLATTLVGSGIAWGPHTDRAHAYLYDDDAGATTLTAAAMHALDAVSWVLGRPEGVSATLAVGRHDVRLVEDDTPVHVTAPDQVAVTGTLPGGAVLSAFYRGGVSRGSNLRWEISGTRGELLITSTTPGNGNLQAVGLQLTGGRDDDDRLAPLPVTDDPGAEIAAVPEGPARNVARLYTALATDLREGTYTVPGFDHALEQHRLAEAIRSAARTGTRQST